MRKQLLAIAAIACLAGVCYGQDRLDALYVATLSNCSTSTTATANSITNTISGTIDYISVDLTNGTAPTGTVKVVAEASANGGIQRTIFTCTSVTADTVYYPRALAQLYSTGANATDAFVPINVFQQPITVQAYSFNETNVNVQVTIVYQRK